MKLICKLVDQGDDSSTHSVELHNSHGGGTFVIVGYIVRVRNNGGSDLWQGQTAAGTNYGPIASSFDMAKNLVLASLSGPFSEAQRSHF